MPCCRRFAQPRLMDMDFAPAQGLYDMCVHVHAQHFDALRGKGGCCRQTDIAQSEDADLIEFQ